MRITSYIAFTFFIFCTYQFAIAQTSTENDFAFRHLTVENNLSQNYVRCIMQDNKGFIWIGTQDGLNRYDGFSFKHFKHNLIDSISISSSSITSIANADNDILLIGTESGGLNILETSTGHFSNFKHNPQSEKSVTCDIITDICYSKDKEYWVATYGGGLNLFNMESGHFKAFPTPNPDPDTFDSFIVKMLRSKDGRIFLATLGGLEIYNPATSQFKSFRNTEKCSNCISSNFLQSIYDDGSQLWIGDYYGTLNCFNKQTETIIQYKTPAHIPIKDIIRMNDSTLWLATDGSGILVFNEHEKKFLVIENDPVNSRSINNNNVNTFFRSSDNLLWVGTTGGGLNLFHQTFNNFKNVDYLFNKNTTKYQQNNYAIYSDSKGIIWSGSLDAGLRAYDTKNGNVTYYQSKSLDLNSISSNAVMSIFEDDENDMWIGTLDGGVNIIDRKSGKIKRQLQDTAKYSINVRSVLCITQSGDRQIWMGTVAGGIYVYNKQAQKLITYRQTNDDSGVNNGTIYDIKKGMNNTMLIGTNGGGLNILNLKTGKFNYFINDPNNKNSISSNNIYCVYEDKVGLLWIGTMGGGLNVFDRKKNYFHCFTENDGLPNNTIYGILPDESGNIWMSSNNGIFKFNYPSNLDVTKLDDVNYFEKNISIKHYDHNDGLIADQFNQGAYFKSKDGTIYFGGVKGIVGFKPQEIKTDSSFAPIVITQVKNYKKDIHFNDSSVIVVDHKNYLSIEFASLSYLSPEKNRYAFMFEDRDTSWNDLGITRSLNFVDLKPGNYILKIMSTNNDGVWGKQPAVIKIKVNPPFYDTWWFRIAVLAALAAAVAVAFRIRINTVRKEEAQKTAFNKSLAEVEMKALRAQMNPHFVFNCLNSIHTYILQNDKLNAADYLTKFSKLIRLILENSRHKTIPLKKDMEALELYITMEQMRMTEKCAVSIEIENEFETGDAMIPPLILQPFVENSFKHALPLKGKEGKLKISITTDNETLVCCVEDNGVGRVAKNETEQNSNRKSLGMTITKERLNMINQPGQANSDYEIIDLKDETGKSCGTRVVVKVPLVY